MLPWSTFGAAAWKRIRDGFWESEESWEVAQLAVEAGIAERVPYDPEKHGEMDAAPGDEIIFPKEIASLPVDAEKDAQIAALVVALKAVRDHEYIGLRQWGGGPCGHPDGPDQDASKCDDPEACNLLRIVWDAIDRTESAATAYTADVRRAAFRHGAWWAKEHLIVTEGNPEVLVVFPTDADIERALAAQGAA